MDFAAYQIVDLLNHRQRDGTSISLIGERGIRKSIRDNNYIPVQYGTNGFIDELCPGGFIEKKFRCRMHLVISIVEEDRAYLLGNLGSAGFSDQSNGISILFQFLEKSACLD